MTSQGTTAHPVAVEAWLDHRPSWLRLAAQDILQSAKRPDDAGIDLLADLCQAEAAGVLPHPHPPIVPGVIQATAGGSEIRLLKVSSIRGVNAFGPQAELEFAEQINVVYGANGSGKSGYARLLKQVCGAKASEPILGNVFRSTNQPVAALISFRRRGTKDGQPFTQDDHHSWIGTDGPFQPLASIHVFDSATAVHVGQTSSTATHLPRAMRLVLELIHVSDRVAERLRQRAQALVSSLPPLPAEYAGTKAAAFYQSLTSSTTEGMIDAGCAFATSDLAERVALQAALDQTDAAGAHAKAEADLTHAVGFRAQMADWAATFDDNFVHHLRQARATADQARRAAQEYALGFFAGVPLPGVGEETWRRMWTAATAYAEQVAYPGHAHPNVGDGARCVLCQQVLDDGAKKRLSAFADYVGKQLEADAVAAEKALATWIQAIPGSQPPSYWSGLVNSIGMTAETAVSLGQQVEQRLTALRAGDLVVPGVDWAPFQEASARRITDLTAHRDALAAVVNPVERQKKQDHLRELRAQEWVSTLRESVTGEVKRKQQVGQLDDALRLAQTTALTKLSNQIAEAEVAGGFVGRFNNELARLGGQSIPVRLTSKAEGKGVVRFSIGLEGATGKVPSQTVLSEGEQRVVALAAFLADVTGTDRSLPVIFDDPISSLDQRYEEAVAARLVDLAKDRQVIVFTHRLSMGVLIDNAAGKPDSPGSVSVTVVAIDRRGADVGVPATIKVFTQAPKKGFNDLEGKVRSALKVVDHDQQQDLLKSACSNFRILLERAVEDHLCANVVMRYRRQIVTKDKLLRLTVVSPEDCALIEGFMTKYSIFEHAQPYETPLGSIDGQDLLKDIETMRAWIAEFDSRKT